MKKGIYLIGTLLILALFITGCSVDLEDANLPTKADLENLTNPQDPAEDLDNDSADEEIDHANGETNFYPNEDDLEGVGTALDEISEEDLDELLEGLDDLEVEDLGGLEE
jgi:hypothetical protein